MKRKSRGMRELNAFQKLFKVFSAAPHRMMFFGGALQLVLTLMLWAVELVGRHSALWNEPGFVIPATSVHIYLMLYGIFPFFTFGFLMTTYPKWMNGRTVPGGSYIPTFFLMVLGVFLFYVGIFLGKGFIVAGLIVHILAWTKGFFALYSIYKSAILDSRYHPFHLNITLSCGIAGELFFLIFILSEYSFFYRAALLAGFWLYLMPLLFIVSHRMLPLFSSGVIKAYVQHRPNWSLPALWLGFAGHTLLELADLKSLLFIFDIPLLVVGLYHTWLWQIIKSLKVRLLAVLHISLLWFSLGMALYSVQSLWLLASGELILGRAPLHALAIGFLTSMVVAMGTRVSLGHSGRDLNMDLFSWLCFWGVQLTALIRVCAELEMHTGLFPLDLNIVAALLWLTFLIPWGLRYGSIYLRPRIDGQPG